MSWSVRQVGTNQSYYNFHLDQFYQTFYSGMETNFVPNNDWLTHYNDDWTGIAIAGGNRI